MYFWIQFYFLVRITWLRFVQPDGIDMFSKAIPKSTNTDLSMDILWDVLLLAYIRGIDVFKIWDFAKWRVLRHNNHLNRSILDQMNEYICLQLLASYFYIEDNLIIQYSNFAKFETDMSKESKPTACMGENWLGFTVLTKIGVIIEV